MNVKSPNGTFASAGAVNAANKIAPQIKPALTKSMTFLFMCAQRSLCRAQNLC